MERRGFLAGLAGAGLGSYFSRAGTEPGAARKAPDRHLDHIGLEVYTVRDELKKDFEGTLARVRQIGYDEIEFGPFPTPDVSVERIKAALSKTGLSAVSGHVSPPSLERGFEAIVDQARTVGLRHLVCAVLWPETPANIGDYHTFATMLNRAGATATAAGIRFGFHNHDLELAPIDGVVPYDVILAETDPLTVFMQMDLYWMTKAGGDPLAYFAKYPGRFKSVHVKDMDGTPGKGMVDVGDGTIDFARIFAQREQAGIEHYFVEHDEPRSPFDSIKRSYEYLRKLTF